MTFVTDQEKKRAYIFAENERDEAKLSGLLTKMLDAGLRVTRENVDTNDPYHCLQIESDNR